MDCANLLLRQIANSNLIPNRHYPERDILPSLYWLHTCEIVLISFGIFVKEKCWKFLLTESCDWSTTVDHALRSVILCVLQYISESCALVTVCCVLLCLVKILCHPYPSAKPYWHWASIWLPQCQHGQCSNPKEYGSFVNRWHESAKNGWCNPKQNKANRNHEHISMA